MSRSKRTATNTNRCLSRVYSRRSLLMLLFCKKYPRWWYDWNLQLTRFSNRIAVYACRLNGG